MEDAHLAQVYLDGSRRLSVFAVFDGHGGPEVAAYCAKHFSEVFVDTPGQWARGVKAGRVAEPPLRDSFVIDGVNQPHLGHHSILPLPRLI
jgi:hypothetical protein